MALPYLDNPASLSDTTVQELDGLVAKLNAYLSQQHNAQGGHGDVTATSLVVDGPVTVRDERLAPASFQRSVARGTQIAIVPTPGGTTPWLAVIYDKVEAVRLGTISGGVYGGPGLRIGPEQPGTGPQPQPWDLVATAVSTGPALVVGDPVRHDRPLALVFNVAGNHYEVRPNAVALDVWLGTNTGATNQFARLYLSDGVYQRGRAVSMGDWQDVPYAAGDFTATGGAIWGVDPGDVLVRRWTIVGHTLRYHVTIASSNLSTAATDLLIALPAGYTVTTIFHTLCIVSNAGAATVAGMVFGLPGESVVHVRATPNSDPWTATASNNTNVFAALAFEVTG